VTVTASPLFHEWDWLQEEVIPPLIDMEGPPKVWSIGSAADAVAIAIAYRFAQPDEQEGDIRIFTDPLPLPEPLSFTLSDVRCIPAEGRDSWLHRRERRWVPDDSIAEKVILAEPLEQVDLVTCRSDSQRPETAAIEHLSPSGRLLLIDTGIGRGDVSCSLETPRIGGGRADGYGQAEHSASPDEVLARESVTLKDLQAQAELVEGHLRLAWSLARRFAHHRERREDLEQVAMLALVKAARRFDPSRDIAFATYATASILGELKRHFRDKTWMMRVPRSLQELFLSVKQTREELGHELGCSPSASQVAQRLGITEEAVLDALEAGDNYWPESLETSHVDDDAPRDIPFVEGAFERSLNRQCLSALLPQLDQREQLILKRLFFDQKTQREVAAEIGVSQMQVSRILNRTIGQLREDLGVDTPQH
jgi:RNA polymerase sigma-B factor